MNTYKVTTKSLKICQFLQIGLLLFSLSLLIDFLACCSFAAPRTVSQTLTRGQKLNVRATRCDLSIKSSSVSKVDIRCGNRSKRGSTPRSNKQNIYLEPKGKVTIKKRACFLASSQINSKRILVRCLATAPTVTPTATATTGVTNTATVTATPTLTATPTSTPTHNAQLLLSSNKLLTFNTDFPAGAATPASISGISAGDSIVSIDRRPNNGVLYGLGYNSTVGGVQLYSISTETMQASMVGSTGSFVDGSNNPAQVGIDASTRFGIDFNPVADRLRVVNNASQNFRINPGTGAFVDGNLGVGSIAGTNMDGSISGGTTTVDETAYTNNALNTSVTTQYTLDSVTDSLYIQNPPNSGTQTLPLSLSSAVVAVRGFDIPNGVNASTSNSAVGSGNAYAVLELASNSQQRFCAIELTTGVISSSAEVANVSGDILGLALQSPDVPMIGLSSDGTILSRFNKATSSTATTVSVTGVDASESLVGLDFRPATGQLYSLGVNATANTATLYLIDPQTGAATTVGSTGSIAFIDSGSNAVDFPATASSGYGFNFNPTVDRIRVVTSSGLNFRINPNTGAAIDGDSGASGVNPDSNINGASTSVHATSYTNAFGGASVTTQYTIDATSDSLMIQSPPNNGTQASQLAVTLNGSSVNFNTILAFEIPRETRTTTSNAAVTSGIGYVILTIGSSTELYKIDLATAALTSLGTATSAMRALAVAQSVI